MNSMLTTRHFLKTERLGFWCWSHEDLPTVHALWGDLEVTRFFGGPFSEEEIAQKREREVSRMTTYAFQYWRVYLLSDNEHLGCFGLRPYRMQDEIRELGFHLRPKYWGQWLAVEAARAVTAYSFETIGVKGLSAGHMLQNLFSKKVLEKLWFRYSNDEFFETLGMDIPYYPLPGPAGILGDHHLRNGSAG